jgi:enamine deaminase RidA (YjgF/YER057c/UK114 family)
MRPGLLALFGLLLFPALGPAIRAADVEAIGRDPISGASQALVVDSVPLAHTAQMLPLDSRGRLVGKSKPDVQIAQVLDNLETALNAAGSGLDRAVKINFYLATQDIVPAVSKVLTKRLAGKNKPAVSFVVGTLGQSDALLAADAVAVSRFRVLEGLVKKVTLAKLPSGQGCQVAILPAGPVVYVSGQAEKGATLAQATRRTLASLRGTLRWLSLEPSAVVQVKCFVHPMDHLAQVRQEIETFFGKDAVPPLVFVEWQAKNSIEIEFITAAPAAKVKTTQPVDYLTPPGMKASPVFSRVCRINHGRRVYVSGLYGEGADAETQVKTLFASLGSILKKSGSDFRHLVKATYYVADEDTSRALNSLRPGYYDPKRPPAASKASVTGTGRKGSRVTLDMLAVVAP